MAEDKQRKVETGRALFDTYQKKKHLVRADQLIDSIGLVDSVFELQVPDPDTDRRMDSVTLQKKTAHVESLNFTIKQLQDSLSEKHEIIESLEIENRVLKEGTGDHLHSAQASGGHRTSLQKQVESRDTFIAQLSEGLQQRSQEVQCLLVKEKELTNEIQGLQKQLKVTEKQSEMKLSESYNEAIEYRAKVELLTNQNQEYVDLVNALRAALESSNQTIDSQKEELNQKNQKLKKYKNETSEDIRKLMRQVEELNHDLSKKEVELSQNRQEIEQLRSQQEEQMGNQIMALKNELEKKYAEDVKKVELYYDRMLLEQIRKSEADLNSVSQNEELEAHKRSYQEKVNDYEENLNKLLQKSRLTEEKLLLELERYKQEADNNRQKVENVENKLAEEIQRIKAECYRELNKYEAEMKVDFDTENIQYYKEEIDSLSAKLKEYALNEAKRDVETETYRNELKKVEDDMSSVLEKLNKYKDGFENQREQIELLETKLDQLRELNLQLQGSLQEFKQNEKQLLHELELSKGKLLEYEQQVYDFNDKLQSESNHLGQKSILVITTFKKQIQNLVEELQQNKQYYEKDLSRLTSKMFEQEKEIKNLKSRITHMVKNENIFDEVHQINKNLNSSCEMEQSNVSKDKIKEYFNESNKEIFQSILNGIKNIRAGLQTFVYGSIENTTELDQNQSGDMDEYEMIVQELELTMSDLQHVIQSRSVVPGPAHQPGMVTSTPHGRDTLNGWMRRCASLENENEQMTKDLDVLSANLKEMEHCLLVATRESGLFNKKCQSLDAKITDLEKSKLSEYMLKKENDELKERLSYMEDAEARFQNELEVLNNNNIRLEQMLHKSVTDLQNKLSTSGPTTELENVLSHLKAKSEELITLKSQFLKLQKSEKENNLKIFEVQSRYDKFVTQYEFLTSELDDKKKELEDLWEERNKLSSENKQLIAKLMSVQDKHSWQASMKSDVPKNEPVSEGSHDGKEKKVSKDKSRDLEGLNSLPLRRLQTMKVLSSTQHLGAKLDAFLPKSSSVAEQIGYQLELLDQQIKGTAYYMPTIPEEDDQEDTPELVQTGLSKRPQVIP